MSRRMGSRLSLGLRLCLLLLVPSLSTAAQGPAVHQQLQIQLDPDERRLSAHARVRVEGGGATEFGLAPGYQVNELRVNGAPVPVGGDNVWQLALEEGGSAEIEMRYTGELPSLAQARAGEAFVFLDAAGGFLPRDAGWYPYFPEGTRYRFELTVDAPLDQRVVALGLREEREREGRWLTRFSLDAPVLGMTLISGPFRVQTLRTDGVDVRTYFTEALPPDLADTYLRASARYLAHYSEQIGPYPYDSFAVVAGPLPVGYGFAGMAYIGEEVLRLPFIPHTSLPHEVLHNWWGNGVYVDYDSGNWSEGLTTFMADYGLVERRDADAARAMRARWLRDYAAAALPAQRDQALAEFVTGHDDAAQLIGYHKAAMVFYMLRTRVGETAFQEGLRHFWQEHRFQTASWSDLQRAFESASGQHLGAFFAHWIERPGAPRLALAVTREGEQLRVELSQGQAAYPLQVPIELQWVDPGGDAQHQRRTLVLERTQRRVVLDAPAARGTLTADPDYELFRHLWPEEIPPILRAVTVAGQGPGVALVVAAPTDAAQVRAAARHIAAESREVAVADLPAQKHALIIGTSDAIDAVLDAHGWTRPRALSGRGAARAWMDPEAPARMFVEGEDMQALAALARVLRHYGNESYLVWDEGRVGERGVWPVEASRLHVDWD